MKILVINGPNINMLGIREPGIYGSLNYKNLCEKIEEEAKVLNLEVEIFQSNHEGAIIDKIQEAYGNASGIVINPAAYTHTSVGILDALKSVGLPTIEVHISNVHKREDFRKKSFTVEACIGQICGLGINGYLLAMRGLKAELENQRNI